MIFFDGAITLFQGDAATLIDSLAPDSLDAVVTDPPYALVSIANRFSEASEDDETQTSERARDRSDQYARLSRGFMNQAWDNGATAFSPLFWARVMRAMKPGAHLVAFGGTRTYHRLACAIEDAGFEIRDCLQWLYGTGFPKSHDVSKGIDKALGASRERAPLGAALGWGTALKPAAEIICLARKPMSERTVAANVIRWGTGAINIDGCRVESEDGANLDGGRLGTRADGWDRPWKDDAAAVAAHNKRVGANVAKAQALGRWPANVVHDGSPEIVAMFPDSAGQQGDVRGNEPSATGDNGIYGHFDRVGFSARADGGSAARFFFSAKADADDRLGSKHPTVKPVDLMRWLCRLVTPPGGEILDPFSGTGTTAIAAHREGFRSILFEREEAYCADIARRMQLESAGPLERRDASIKASGKTKEPGPLFADRSAAE